MEGNKKMAQPMRYIRKCGHPNDAVIFMVTTDNIVKLYCMGCLVEKVGLQPVEELSLEQFAKKYGGKEQ